MAKYRVFQQKMAQICGTTFLQQYFTESCGFQLDAAAARLQLPLWRDAE